MTKKKSCTCDYEWAAMREDRNMFQAQVEALKPLARLGLCGLDGGAYYLSALVEFKVSKPNGKETAATIRAREILAFKRKPPAAGQGAAPLRSTAHPR